MIPPPIPPECALCGEPSLGAKFLSFVGGYGVGKQAWVVEFRCKTHAEDYLPLMSSNLNQWKVVSRNGRGVYGVRKLTEAEQNVNAVRVRESMR